jgi:hypothetical protein
VFEQAGDSRIGHQQEPYGSTDVPRDSSIVHPFPPLCTPQHPKKLIGCILLRNPSQHHEIEHTFEEVQHRELFFSKCDPTWRKGAKQHAFGSNSDCVRKGSVGLRADAFA